MTLADELATLEARRREGLISDADAERAKDALLARATGPAEARPNSAVGWMVAGLFSNLFATLLVLVVVGLGIFWMLPMVYAVPALIILVLLLPLLKVMEWFGDLFS